MGKLKLILIIFLVITTAGLIVLRYSKINSQIKRICFEAHCFSVEIADTEAKRQQGLKNREKLDEDAGMLFLFPSEAKHSFWIKETKIPLDIIWMDKDWKIVAIKSALSCLADPCPYYSPEVSSKYALEINSLLSEKNKIKIGNKAENQ